MKARLRTFIHCSLVLLLSQALDIAAQEEEKPGECALDEIDMGDYCASLPPAITEEDRNIRRVTRYRGKSMMPGRADDDSVPLESEPSTAPIKPVLGVPGLPGKPVTAMQPAAANPSGNLSSVAPPAITPPPDTLAQESPQPYEAAEMIAKPEPSPALVAAGSGYVVQLGAFSSRSVAATVAQGVHAEGIPVALARLETRGRVLWASFAGPYEEMEKAKNVRDQMRQKREFAAAWVKPVDQLPLIGLNDETFEK